MAPQPWNLGPPKIDFSPLGNLGQSFQKGYDSSRKRVQEDADRELFAAAAQGGDLNKVGMAFLGRGLVQEGAALLSLGQKQAEKAAEAKWMEQNAGLFGGAATGGAPAKPAATLGTPNDVENTFVSTVKQAGLTNPVGLGAVAAYGKAESGFSPQNVNRTWSDPSESGQAGTSGGIMSWRAERLQGLQNFARERGENAPSVETQALYLAKEDPTLIPKLNAAKTPQEANQIMANAWRFAGYNRPGGENARREALTVQYAQRFAGQGGQPAAQAAQASGQAVQPIAGDDPIKLRQEAEAYAQTNPEAARQMLARADAAERARGVQTAQAGDPRADQTPGTGAPTQFVIPGTGQTVSAGIAADPQVQNLTRALDGAPERFKAGIQKRLEQRVEDLKFQRGEDSRQADVELKRLQAEAERRKLAGDVPAPAGYRYKAGTKELEAIPGGPAFEKTPAAEVESRKAAAARAGVTPTDPRYQSYVLTGKTPREDAQPLSATDKKAILEADEGVLAGETAIRALNEAKGLSKQAMSGPTAGARAAIGNNLPDWAVPDFIASPGSAEATTNLENTVTAQALAQMKSIFGAAPTEGERKILLDIQGSINQPDNVRQKIYDRAIKAAEARLSFNKQRASELRGGDYYKAPGARQGGAEQPRAAQQEAAPAQPQGVPQGARQAPDGNFYVPDPSRPGKFLMVQP